MISACGGGTNESSESAEARALSLGAVEVAGAADWPNYNRDLAGSRFSPLTQVDTGNVSDLAMVWSLPLRADDSDASGIPGTAPLAIGGRLYVAGLGYVAALDATTGNEIWHVSIGADRATPRGLTYWSEADGAVQRIFATVGRSLLAIDADSGEPSTEFGQGGEIELEAPYLSAPTRFDDLLVVGSDAEPGGVHAYDAVTGDVAWTFTALPGTGGLGAASWEQGAAESHPGIAHPAWSFAIDVDRELLFATFGSPGPTDFYGGNRQGDNLFANSIVALDVRTGAYRWHFQTVHHDVWGFDLPAAPTLHDVELDGQLVPLVALTATTGYVYLLNRENGAPVFGIDERSVPAASVPGEVAAATQPIPRRPPPISKIGFASSDVVTASDTNSVHATACSELVQGVEDSVGFAALAWRNAERQAASSVFFPGPGGGPTRGGAATDPSSGYVFVNTVSVGGIGWLERTDADNERPVPMNPRGTGIGAFIAPADADGSIELPCQRPPWSELMAIDVTTADIAWRVPLGSTERDAGGLLTAHLGVGGPTATAGGLVFVGAADDRRFRAFDSTSGAELWSAELSASAASVPVTYLGSDGRQYVVIATGGLPGEAGQPELVAFALPEADGPTESAAETPR